jgi:hypothetical protein
MITWTDEKVIKLRELASAGTPNKEIAAQLGMPVEKIYAKRSQLGITIDKVASKAEKPGVPDQRVHRDIELRNKKQLLHKLFGLVTMWCPECDSLQLLGKGDIVLVRYCNGSTRKINIECDSLSAIVLDVVQRV